MEVCAGAGGQALGLELAGFDHAVAVEVSRAACATIRANRPGWRVAEGDVTSRSTWDPAAYEGAALLAGGVPCQPFSVGGKQLGADDERDLFAWTIENLVPAVAPRAVMLENVPGLAQARFAPYRQHVLDRLASLGYAADWRILNASDYGVPQLRPRFILVAMRPEDFACFTWPEPRPGPPPTVGEALLDMMAAGGWPGARAWAERANSVAPTLVGGSLKHGGPDLGPSRAKKAWRAMGTDPLGIADAPPSAADPVTLTPRLTALMCSVLQGWDEGEYRWAFPGKKTPVYRQIGNAFPPPVARAVGERIRAALDRQRQPRPSREAASVRDPVYAVLRADGGFLTLAQIRSRLGRPVSDAALGQHLDVLRRDFAIEEEARAAGAAYRLGRLRSLAAEEDEAARRRARGRPRRPAPALQEAPARRAG